MQKPKSSFAIEWYEQNILMWMDFSVILNVLSRKIIVDRLTNVKKFKFDESYVFAAAKELIIIINKNATDFVSRVKLQALLLETESVVYIVNSWCLSARNHICILSDAKVKQNVLRISGDDFVTR